MRRDIQDALASVGEVAVFAWSLLELLLTRILPLAGFLAGHLLLQLGGLLGSCAVTATAAGGWRQSRAGREDDRYSACEYDVQVKGGADQELELVDQLIINEGGGKVGSADDAENDHVESLMKSTAEDEIAEESLTLASIIRHDEVAGADVNVDVDVLVQAAAAPMSATPPPRITDAEPAAELGGEQQVHVAESVASDAAGVGEGDEQRLHVASKGEDSTGRMDLEPSDHVQTSTRPVEALRSSSRRSRRIRVLPPSLSQIKRSLMQRSRRSAAYNSPAAAAASKSRSPAAAGSSSSSSSSSTSPSPKQQLKKKDRKLASPALKTSSPADNFMGKFRKHFLLDPA